MDEFLYNISSNPLDKEKLMDTNYGTLLEYTYLNRVNNLNKLLDMNAYSQHIKAM